ncbi:peroxiredoxin family protein [Pedobacter insulae]|uniref:AhpC/TSA family protein n=1 Tax=Pedobacter insulae TaxID=414048 RepID=A0A1I3APC4_9SPHI|nr:TlpA disulfide reductase family protein [Pedobacter insulae]SFH51830.1 AhpC/TSA family protein [Pedobacter insulae]
MKKIFKLSLPMLVIISNVSVGISQVNVDDRQSVENAKIVGQLHGLEGDTLTLSYWVNALGLDETSSYKRAFAPVEQKIIVAKDGSFSVRIPVYKKLQYFSLKSNRQKTIWKEEYFFRKGKMDDISTSASVPVLNWSYFILEPGDDIKVVLQHGQMSFSGTGAEKIKYLNEFKYSQNRPKSFQSFRGDSLSTIKRISYYDDLQQFGINILKKYHGRISPMAYQVLQADIIGHCQYYRYSSASLFNSYKDPTIRRIYLNIYKEQVKAKALPLLEQLSTEVLGLSKSYPLFWQQRFKVEQSYLLYNAHGDGVETQQASKNDLFEAVLNLKKGLLKDKLIVMNCSDMLKVFGQVQVEERLATALTELQDPTMYAVVKRFRDDFSKGQLTYDFTMEDVEGNHVRLSDFRGKVVFVDIWFTGCGGCVSVAKAMRDKVEPHFEGKDDVVFLSISIDKDKRMWKNSITKDAKRDPKLSYQRPGAHYSGDKTIYLRTLNGSDDPFIKKYVTNAYPTLMLIDREGKVFAFSAQRPDGGKAKLLIDQINDVRKL